MRKFRKNFEYDDQTDFLLYHWEKKGWLNIETIGDRRKRETKQKR